VNLTCCFCSSASAKIAFQLGLFAAFSSESYMKTFLTICLLATVPFCVIVGCGGGEGTTLIQPAQNYQPTAEEQKMQQEMDAARGSGQQ